MVAYGTPKWLIEYERQQILSNDDAKHMIDWLLGDAIFVHNLEPETAVAKAKQYGFSPKPTPVPEPAKRGSKPKGKSK